MITVHSPQNDQQQHHGRQANDAFEERNLPLCGIKLGFEDLQRFVVQNGARGHEQSPPLVFVADGRRFQTLFDLLLLGHCRVEFQRWRNPILKPPFQVGPVRVQFREGLPLAAKISRDLQHFVQQQFRDLERANLIFVVFGYDRNLRFQSQTLSFDNRRIEYPCQAQRRYELGKFAVDLVYLAFGRFGGTNRVVHLPPFLFEFRNWRFERRPDSARDPSECRSRFCGKFRKFVDRDDLKQVLAQVDRQIAH